jgi:glycosyltransferase involved in cell wall biosynthesis
MAAVDIRGIPRIVTAHGNLVADTSVLYRGVGRVSRSWLRKRFSVRVIKQADVIVGVNPEWSVNLPTRPRRFLYIPNIIDECFYTTTHERERATLLFAGGTAAIKGWELLAATWPLVRRALPEARLQVAGWTKSEPPPLAGSDRASVFVDGWLSSEDLAARMASASALVIPSQFEVSPIVLGEAWAAGLPVVATPVGGLPPLADGAAIVVPRRDPQALADGIVRALEGGEEIERQVAEGHRRAEAQRADAVAQAHINLYRELVAGGGN